MKTASLAGSLVVSVFFGITAANAQQTVNLRLNAVTPTSATPGLTTGAVFATGFPAGTILPAKMKVVLRRPNTPLVELPVASIATVIGAQRRVNFAIPASLAVTQPTAYTVSLAGTMEDGTILATQPPELPLTLLPPASLLSVTPASLAQGAQNVAVVFDAQYSNFLAGQTTLAISGAGITLNSLVVNSRTRLTANLSVAPGAAISARNVTIQTGGETIQAGNVLQIAPSNASISLVSPATGQQGQTLDVTITGGQVFFEQGVTQVGFGDGVTVNSTTVLSSTQVRANVAIAPLTAIGSRTVTVNTNGQIASRVDGFAVVRGPATLSNLNPAQAQQGQTLTVDVTGSQTHFSNATTVAISPFADVTVGIAQVISPTLVRLNVAVADGAQLGNRTITLTTGGEQASGTFTITPGTPVLLSVLPTSGKQGETLGVNLTGKFTNFAGGANGTNVNFGAGVTVNSLTVNSPTSLTANVTVSAIATVGARTVTVVTPSASNETVTGAFAVTAGNATLSSIAPNTAKQGQQLQVEINGTGTNFQQGVTQVSMGLINGVTVNGVTVQSSTKLLASITISNNASLGARTVTVTTGGEVVTLANGFTVTAGTPVILSVTPPQGVRGQSVAVTVEGQFTSWQQGTTTLAVSGGNVAVQGLAIVDADTLTATLVIEGAAATGTRTLTVTTGSEIVTSSFQVQTNNLTTISSVVPSSALQGTQNLDVIINGTATNFVQGQSGVTFSGMGITVGTVTVNSPTQLTVRIQIADNAAATSRDVTVTTGAEVVTRVGGFTVQQAAPQLTQANPTQGQQGQTLNVGLTGRFTRWTQGTNTVSFGTGITVNSVNVTSDTSLSANITINPTTTLGLRTVSVSTLIGGNTDVATGTDFFTVVAGPATISGINPSSAKQNDTVNNVVITGTSTNFAQGVSVLSLGAGITVLQTVVNSPTQITANIQIDPNATVGARTVTVTTGGQVATLSNGFQVQAATPVLLSVTENAVAQGQQRTVAILGQFTRFTQSPVTVSFGAGVTVGAVTVNNDTSLSVSITVSPLATTGLRDVVVNYGSPAVGVTLVNGFQVNAGPAAISSISPISGQQNTTIASMTVTGINTHFEAGKTVATFFDSKIVIGALTVNSPTQVTLTNIVIASDATPGARTIRLTTEGETANGVNLFTVGAGTPILSSLTPVSGVQGATLNVQINGSFTNFAGGTNGTNVNFGAGVTVNSVTVNSATLVTANISILPTANTGARTVTVVTPSAANETVTGSFAITPSNATISSIAPTTAKQGDQLQVEINGTNTNFQQGVTQVSFGGLNGISVTGVTVQSSTRLLASLTISNTATIGLASVSVVTLGESLVLSNAFNVTAGTATVLSLLPAQGIRGNTIPITIEGRFTNWTPGVTTVEVSGANVAVQNLTIVDADTITANLVVDAIALTGTRTVSVSTGPQQLLSSFTINANPQTTLSSISPSSAVQGTQNLDVVINGTLTNFAQSVTTVAFGGSGITVSSVTVNSPTQLTARLQITDTAAAGARTVTVTTVGEILSLTNAFTVISGTPQITQVNPAQGQQGQTLNVALTGRFTRWTQGTNTASFGDGVTVNSLNVTSDTAATANITIAATTAKGFRNVSVSTVVGAVTDVAGANSAFQVTAGPAVLTSVTPSTGKQGETVANIVIAGTATNFATGISTANFGSGITVTQSMVNSATQMTVTVQIDAGAAVGVRAVTVTTNGEQATLANAFTVQAATPVLLSVTDNSANQGQQKTVTILGAFTKFTQSPVVVDFGTAVTVGSVTVNNDTSLTVVVTPSPIAFTGARTVTVNYGSPATAVTLVNGFMVTPGPATLLSVSPTSAQQGQTLTTLVVAGQNTNFQDGKTTATFFDAKITFSSLVVNSPTQVTLNNVQVAVDATPGPRTIRITTDGENASGTNLFAVVAATPVISSVSPTSGAQGQTVDVTVNGSFTSFAQGATTASFGAGITVNTVTVNSATQLVANITISPTASTGARNIGVTTTLAGGVLQNATLSGGFSVTATSYTITSVTPQQGGRGRTLVVSVVGNNTNFANGQTSASFGGGISTSAVTVTSATEASVQIQIDAGAALGFRDVTFTTGGQVARRVNGFEVVQGTPTLLSANPATGRQGDVNRDVIVTGEFTSFQQGVTQVSFGAGITVSQVTVNSATQLTARLQIAVNADQGSRTVTVTTNTEVVSRADAFTVQAGLPQITNIDPNQAEQGANVTLVIDGAFTNWDQTTPVVSFAGGGITVGTVQVNGPTRITVPVQLSTSLTPGARTVTVTAGAQVASLVNGFTVLQGIPKITEITPNVGVRGTSNLAVVIRGQFAGFTNATTVQFGAGISVGGAAEAAAGPISTLVNSNEIRVNISINAGATLGVREVRTNTGGTELVVANGFNVSLTDTTPPTLLTISPFNSATNVPLNSVLTLEFNEPINRTTFNSATFQLYESVTNRILPGTYSVDASGRIATFTPSESLLANRSYTPYHCASQRIQDQSGNNFGCVSYNFTTGLDVSTIGPSFVISNIVPASTGVATNAPVRLLFSQSISPTTRPTGARVLLSGVEVPGNWTFDQQYRLLQFVPTSAFATNTQYTVEYTTNLQNFAGYALQNPGSFTFTTGTGTDTVRPTISSLIPASQQSGLPLTTQILGRFSEALDLTRFEARSQVYFYDYNDQGSSRLLPGTLAIDADRAGFRFLPTEPLKPSTQYQIYVCSYYDIASNPYNSCPGHVFYTGTTVSDTTAPTVSVFSPAPNATGIGTNINLIQAQMSEPVTTASLQANPDAFQVLQGGNPIAGSVTLSTTNFRTLTFTPSAALLANTVYTIRVQKLRDPSGNQMTLTEATFTTTTGVLNTSFGRTSAVPANGATNVATNQAITVVFARDINPITLVRNSSWNIRVQTSPAASYVNYPVSMTLAGNTMVVTPEGGWPAGANVILDLNTNIRDFTNNAYNAGSISFAVAAGPADTTAPTVSGISPANGATGIGDITEIEINFSEAMNPSTLVAANIAVYQGPTVVGSTISISQDNKQVTLSLNLLANQTYTVVVTPGVTDLAGNPLAAELRSSFSTAGSFSVSSFSITNTQPNGSGVPRTAAVVLYSQRPVQSSTVNANSVVVLQNGVRITGSLSLGGDNRTITFRPSGLFAYGALIQVFYYNTILDNDANTLNNGSFQFTVETDPATTNLTLNSWGPVNQSTNEPAPRNFSLWFRFNQPLDPTTVNNTVVQVRDVSNVSVPITVQLVGDRSIRVTQVNPATLPFNSSSPGNNYVYWNITGLKSLTNKTYNGSTYIYYGNDNDTVAPGIQSLAPFSGSTVVGTNASIRIYLTDLINAAAIESPSVTITGPSGAIPFSARTEIVNPGSFSSTYNPYHNGGKSYHLLVLEPSEAMPPSSLIQVSLSGIVDAAGNALPVTNYSFTTINGPDFDRGVSEGRNIQSGDTNVPVNSILSMLLSEPADEGSVRRWFYLYDNVGENVTGSRYYDGTFSFSPDRKFVTFVPSRNMTVGRSHQFGQNTYFLDQSGNAFNLGAIYFTTAFTADTTPPQIQSTNPQQGGTAPYTTRMQIRFNEPISEADLRDVKLLVNGTTEVTVTRTLSNANRVLTLAGLTPLLQSTSYTISIAGVKDIAGNLMPTQTVSFTTTTGADLIRPTISSVSPAMNSTDLPTNTVFRVRFSEPIAPVSLEYLQNVRLFAYNTVNLQSYVLPATLTLSADRREAVVTPATALPMNSQLYFELQQNYTDLSGNTAMASVAGFLYTGATNDTTAPTVSSINPTNNSTGVGTNATVTVTFSEPVQPATISNSTITLTGTGPIAGLVSIVDSRTLRFTPSSALPASTTINVAVSGVSDVAGNPMANFASSFQTGAGTVTGNFTMVSMTGQGGINLNNAANVPQTTNIVITYSRVINPSTFRLGDTFRVLVTPGGGVAQYDAPMTASVNGAVVTVTLNAGQVLPPNTSINARQWNSGIQDLNGNAVSFHSVTFTTGSGVADTAAPTVSVVSPANGATNVSRFVNPTITFSEPMNRNLLTAANLALLGPNQANVTGSVSASNDGMSVTMNPSTLAANTTYTIVVLPVVADVLGNPMGQQFVSQFTTGGVRNISAPKVSETVPTNGSTGWSRTVPLTIYFDKPLNPATVNSSTVRVSEQGDLITGTLTLRPDGRTLVFTPSAQFGFGRRIDYYITNGVQDLEGNPADEYNGYFTVAADTTGQNVTLLSWSPASQNSTQPAPRNFSLTFRFNKPLNPASVNSTNVFMRDVNNAGVPLNIELVDNNQTIRITPVNPNALPFNAGNVGLNYVYWTINGVQGANGGTYNGSTYIYYGQNADTTAPTVTLVNPANGVSGVGVNGKIRVVFSETVNSETVNDRTIVVSGPSGYRAEFYRVDVENSGRDFTLFPLTPMPANATMTLSVVNVSGELAVTDAAGNRVVASTTTFQTGATVDTVRPNLVRVSPAPYGTTNIPRNVPVVIEFDKPMDLSSVTQSMSFYWNSAYQRDFTITPSSDLRTFVLKYNTDLPATTYVQAYPWFSPGLRDLTGNTVSGLPNLYFQTNASTDTTPPVVEVVSPAASAAGVPLNATVRIRMNEPILTTAVNVAGIRLLQNGNVVPTTLTTDGVQQVVLTPIGLMQPLTTYTIEVASVRDITNNLMLAPVSFTFTTGSVVDLSAPTMVAVRPLNGTTGVDRTNPGIEVEFSDSMDLAQMIGVLQLRLTNTSTVVPSTLSYKPGSDGRIIQITPATLPLNASTSYQVYVTNFSLIDSVTGLPTTYTFTLQGGHSFTTGN